MKKAYLAELEDVNLQIDELQKHKRKILEKLNPINLYDWIEIAKIDKVAAICFYHEKYNTDLRETKEKFEELMTPH